MEELLLTEGTLLAIHRSVFLHLGVELQLFDTLVLGQEVAWPDEVFKIIRGHTVLELESFDFRLNDHVVSDDSSHASRSII